MNLWDFRGVAFKRLGPGDSDAQWFPQSLALTIDVAAGDAAGGVRRWVDIGGWEVGPLTMTAALTSDAAADSLIAMRGTVGTLTNVHARSGQALLRRADKLISDGGPFVRVALEFELAS